MIWDEVATKLAAILHVAVKVNVMPLEEWKAIASSGLEAYDANRDTYADVVSGPQTMFRADVNVKEKTVTVLVIASDRLTSVERALIAWSLDNSVRREPKGGGANVITTDKLLEQLRVWLLEALESNGPIAEAPPELLAGLGLGIKKIPILVTADSPAHSKSTYGEFLKVLEQFFGASVMMLPMKEREWLIMTSSDLIGGEREGEVETVEEELDAIAMGLHEMLVSDWDFECHVSVHYPIVPGRELVNAVRELRRTDEVGRLFRFGNNVHSPWQLRLETLLHAIPETETAAFLRSTLSGKEEAFDSESLAALEVFFENDCSVSETAKQLYIHRNTLLYRLDKFKQETGLDVRKFSNAVLVKIAIALYKVTKRKL